MLSGPALRLLLDCLTIIVIDLLLAGDNALVIAMAVRVLPKQQRRGAIIFGAGAAVVLRVILTIAAARLLGVEFLKLVGGSLVVWIAIKVLADASSSAPETPAPKKLLQTIWIIVMADITMSLDNILAVAGAARGSMALIIFGLGVSIPFIVFSSNLIAVLMDRYPVILYLGSAILGKVGAEMMLTDPFVARTWHPTALLTYLAEAIVIVLVLVVGKLLSHRRHQEKKPA